MVGQTSWGNFPKAIHAAEIPLHWKHHQIDFSEHRYYLPFGLGRSYGDSCLNDGYALLMCEHLNHYCSFDAATGRLHCEAGVTLNQILCDLTPLGWFLPVTPGTKYVTVGGAIANDVHGKNHHLAGSFGCYVLSLHLLRSDGNIYFCSPTNNSDLFAATIGGIGLTGVILSAELQLRKISSVFIDVEHIRFESINDFFSIDEESTERYEYTVAWLDSSAAGKHLGRGIYMRGNHAEQGGLLSNSSKSIAVPFEFPSFVLNNLFVKGFNALYYRKQWKKYLFSTVHYNSFFYPLDSILHWNRIYGKSGFLQYQCVVPFSNGMETINEILQQITASGMASFLTVFKKFGSIASPGLLSFPQPGYTLALDFRKSGEKLFTLFDILDAIVAAAGGRIYPAKDARMSAETFQNSYPQWHIFEQFVDDKFSSSFWRRVASTNNL